VSLDAAADRLADHHSDPRRLFAGQVATHVHDEAAAPAAGTIADDGGELTGPPHSIRPRQHRPSRQSAYADSEPRPLRRRAAMMARPARVRMRKRKPCVLARRRLFG
jgi:hypothetical protein